MNTGALAQVVVNLILCGIIAGLAAALSGSVHPAICGRQTSSGRALALPWSALAKVSRGKSPPRPPADILSACHMH